MKQILKFFIPLFFTVSICMILVSYTAGTNENNLYSAKKSFEKEPSPSPKKVDIQDGEVTEAATQNSQPEKYILKYNPEEDMVVLITRREDGTEIISHIKSIDPQYLEKTDIDALISGIELSSKEDMFILIEDYSS